MHVVLAGHAGVVGQPGGRHLSDQRVVRQVLDQLGAVGEVRHVAAGVGQDDLLKLLVGFRVAHQAGEGGDPGAGREEEQPAPRFQRIEHQGAGRLAAEQHRVSGPDMAEPRGQRAVFDLDREEVESVVPGRAGDGIGAQQRPPVDQEPEHDELAGPEPEAHRSGHPEREQLVGPVPDTFDLLERYRARQHKTLDAHGYLPPF